ncbi:MAG TPA: DUF116 domain-containing protein [Methanoculleus sp.]|nr:DUF116 domain-containing protein [Methanoculleus sp.]
MVFDALLWTQLMVVVGELTVILVVGALLFASMIVMVAFLSIKNGRFYFPRLMASGLVMMEGTVKAICKLCGLDDKELTLFFIRLHNTMNMSAFGEIPLEKRAIFLPQCLRSAQCPAHLTPEGLVCRRCGRCGIGESIATLESMGYRVFIVPGSTFIKRIVKKYRPEGIIGVGCLMEVKEGFEMTDRFGLVSMGVVTLKDGCVETIVDWHDVLEVAGIGIEEPSVAEHLDVPPG